MDERRLEVFTAVGRLLSFSEAARTLHLSQPAVSQQIARLETELGVRLFQRTRRRVLLTPAGAALLARSGHLLRELAEARRAVAASVGRVEGALTVAASLTIGGYVLPDCLAELSRRHPDLFLRVEVENSTQVFSSLLSGAVDVGFVEGEVAAEGIVVEPLRDDELLVAAPVEHPFAAREEIPLGDLATVRFIARETGSGTREVADAHLRAAGVDPATLNVVAELSGIEAIKAAVQAGIGVSIVSRTALAREIAAGMLVGRRIETIRMRRQMASAVAAGAIELPAARELVELVRAAAPAAA